MRSYGLGEGSPQDTPERPRDGLDGSGAKETRARPSGPGRAAPVDARRASTGATAVRRYG